MHSNFYKKILLLLVISISLIEQLYSIDKRELLNKVDAYVNKESGVRNFNGVILISDEKDIIFQKAIGTCSRGNQDQITINTQFCVGSIVKQMTAALILLELEKDSFLLDDSISMFFPEYTNNWSYRVTVHHLLNHSSGIVSLNEPLEFEPGTRFLYSNINYDLLGMILEKIHHKTCAQIFKELFARFNMTASTFATSIISFSELRKMYPSLCQGYMETTQGELVANETSLDPSKNASGGLISTAVDLQKWIKVIFGEGILESKSMNLMLTPSSSRSHRYSASLGYGYGIQILTEEGLFEVSHSGHVPGFTSTMVYYPDFKITVIILENRSWLTTDIKKCFFMHDKIREIVRTFLQKDNTPFLTLNVF